MASACVNNIGVPPENFHDCPSSAFPAYGWLSPRISFARVKSEKTLPDASEAPDLAKDHGDFEFRLDDNSVTMLPADELFSDGKLVPLQLTTARPAATEGVSSPEARKSSEMLSAIAGDPCLQSPKAPRCSTRWRKLIGFKKNKQEIKSTTSFSTSSNSSPNTGKSIRQFLHKNSKSMSSKDSDCDSSTLSIPSSRLSLSSSSSYHDLDDLPRPSLDADKKPSHSQIPLPQCSSSGPNQSLRHHRARSAKPMMVPATVAENPKPSITRSIVSADSPRMSSSGKIVFQSLERSSSSPSSFNGGPRYRHRGMERSYSANVRVTPVLNVPVCSLRGSSKSGVFGFGKIFSSQSHKKESNGGTRSSKNPSTATTIVRSN